MIVTVGLVQHRGYLSLRMLLSSEMRLSFVTDAGITEWIPARSSELETSGVILEYLATDPSGRSFVLKSPGHKLSFFWQSESSKAVGDEMVCKVMIPIVTNLEFLQHH
jgi:hypothetical protein